MVWGRRARFFVVSVYSGLVDEFLHQLQALAVQGTCGALRLIKSLLEIVQACLGLGFQLPYEAICSCSQLA